MCYEKFELKVIDCPKCKKKMIDAGYFTLRNAFPAYYKKNLFEQLKEKNMVIRSDHQEGYHYVCKDCIKLIEFKCWGCKETKLRKEVKYEEGDPPDFLCNGCYETKPAKEWDKLKEEISAEHRWDYT